MTDFIRRPCSSSWASCRTLSASAPPARKASRHSLRVAAVTPYLRLVDSRSAPRSSSRTTLALRLAERAALAAAVDFRARAGRPPGSLCGPGNRRIGVGHLSLLVSQISFQRNRAAGDALQRSNDSGRRASLLPSGNFRCDAAFRGYPTYTGKKNLRSGGIYG